MLQMLNYKTQLKETLQRIYLQLRLNLKYWNPTHQLLPNPLLFAGSPQLFLIIKISFYVCGKLFIFWEKYSFSILQKNYFFSCFVWNISVCEDAIRIFILSLLHWYYFIKHLQIVKISHINFFFEGM